MFYASPHFLDGVSFASKTIHLCPASNPRLYGMPSGKRRDARLEQIVVSGRVWPRTDDRHISPEHVNELRQFIDVGSTQDPTNTCHTRVVSYSLCEFMSVLVYSHRSELEHLHRLVVKAMTELAEEDWATGVEPYCYRNGQEQWRENHQANSRGKNVKRAFYGSVKRS